MNKRIALIGLFLSTLVGTPCNAGGNLRKAQNSYNSLSKLSDHVAGLLEEGADKVIAFLESNNIYEPKDLVTYLEVACIPGLLGELANGLAEGYAVYAMGSPNPHEITRSALYSVLGNFASCGGSGFEIYSIANQARNGVTAKKVVERFFDILTDITRMSSAAYFTRSDAKKFFDARVLSAYNTRPDRTMRRTKVLEFLYLGISFGLFPLIRYFVRPLEIKKAKDREEQAYVTGAVVRLVQSLFEVYRRHHRYELEFGEYEDMDPEDIPQQVIIYRQSGEPIIATLPPDQQGIS